MILKVYATLIVSSVAILLSSCSTGGSGSSQGVSAEARQITMFAKVGEVDRGFVSPLAPSPSAKPSTSLPNMGRDRHKMPFYHTNQRTRVVRTTAYTHSESDHVVYGPRNAVGTSLKYTSTVRSAAADWSVYPLGTKFRVKGQPYLYVVDDYGSALVGTGTVDIYQPTKSLMRQWGRRYIEITIVQWGSPELSMDVLSGRRGYRHCRAMYAVLSKLNDKGFYAKAE
ncbi:MAG: 3D domain-containing protein [Akkermansia sp.]